MQNLDYLPIRIDNKLPLSKKEQLLFKEKIYILRAYASDYTAKTKKMPSRDIAIRGNTSLEKMIDTVLYAFEFDNEHLHSLSNNLKEPHDGTEVYTIRYDPDPMERVSTDEIIVAQAFDKIGKKMVLEYDFGDDWRFIIEVLEIRDKKPTERRFPYIYNLVGAPPVQYEEYFEEEIVGFDAMEGFDASGYSDDDYIRIGKEALNNAGFRKKG